MRDFIILFIQVIVTVVRLAGPGGLRSVVAESALIRHQLLLLNRGRNRASNLRATDRPAADSLTLLISPARILRSAIVLKPSTLLHLHSLLRKRKYGALTAARLFITGMGPAGTLYPARSTRSQSETPALWGVNAQGAIFQWH